MNFSNTLGSTFLSMRAAGYVIQAIAAGIAVKHGQQLNRSVFVLRDILLLAFCIGITTAARAKVAKARPLTPVKHWFLEFVNTVLKYLGIIGVLILSSWVDRTLFSSYWTIKEALRYVPFFLAIIAAVGAMQFSFYTAKEAPGPIA